METNRVADTLQSKEEFQNALKQSRRERRRKFLRTLFSRKLVLVGAIGVLFFIGMAVFAPLIAPYDPSKAFFADTLVKPSFQHLLGTDNNGRDVLSRMIYGSRVSLIIGVLAVSIGCVVGTFLGMCAGYFGGWLDDLLNRISEALRSIPDIVFAMALAAVLGSGIRNLAIIFGITSLAGYFRMMRAQVMSIKESDYVMAGMLQGNRSMRLMMAHILPNSISPLIVMMTNRVGTTILGEAGLSFLGVGISEPTASWGCMVSEGSAYLLQNPVFGLAPGICIALLVISLNVLGDGLRDALDPRLRGEL